ATDRLGLRDAESCSLLYPTMTVAHHRQVPTAGFKVDNADHELFLSVSGGDVIGHLAGSVMPIA
ncbi:MAG: hypothetical protein WD425_08310, partial [Nitrospirales bacterium]